MIAILVLAGACDSTGDPQASGSPSAEPREPPEPLPQVEPPELEGNLTAKAIERCLLDRVDPADYAGVYANVQELVAGQVAETRSLDFDAPAVEFLEKADFDDAVADLDTELPEDDEITTKLLGWTLGFTKPGLNVNRFLNGNDSGLIAGFYIPSDQSIVIERKGKLDVEYLVMAHEFAHAATDQAFGLPKGKTEPIVDDALLAQSALVEGDASLTELRVISRLSPKKSVLKAINAQIKFRDVFEEGRAEFVPYLLIDNAVFPYRWGLAFACEVYRKEGWRPLNRAYRKPPTTTAQILFPDRFLKGEDAQTPAELTKPGGDWQLLDQGPLGAAHLKAMFEAPGDDENASLSNTLARVAAWAGGQYRVWTLGDQSKEYVTGVSLVEHEDYKGLLCSSMYRWYRRAFSDDRMLVADRVVRLEGPEQDAFLSCQGRDVTLAIGTRLGPAKAVIGLR